MFNISRELSAILIRLKVERDHATSIPESQTISEPSTQTLSDRSLGAVTSLDFAKSGRMPTRPRSSPRVLAKTALA